ncbi:H(+)-transporting ATPase [Faecalicatena contorta]|uniref:TrkH family potassium uptake protein n=1 Tax=Faecalicatena contorta TaxID=39482 RepID=UPI00196179CA|nr:potassium transporter TrkG [Faecalicatena contorta]MBM6684739.1 H(+)-transporting ATPase [Faecalicatena contorta]MBM6709717.1 H(+)-transporting ATPase [Faecalicatena contorta]
MKNRILQNGFFKRQPAGRLITLGFALVILLGAVILCLPVSVRDGAHVSFIDALFTSTSAVCVTGLIAIDTADHFTAFGQGMVALLIQIGGLGVTSVGVGLILAVGKRVSIKTRLLVKEALNVDSNRGIVRLIRAILFMTLLFEAAGAVLSYPVFSRDHEPLHAVGISIFHSIAAFNNSGFDILGGLRNLTIYQDSVLLNLTTAGLIIFGGLGFLVILDIAKKKSFRRLSFHSKVVISTSIALIIAGTLLLKATEEISWLGAFFQSVSARTAGFSTYNIGDFTNAGLFVLCVLMFIGASPGSTGGGIKTSTFFVLLQAAKSACVKKNVCAFRRSISQQNISKASMITVLSMSVVCVGTFLLCVLEPDRTFIQVFFEVVSAFGTVGLSTGITPTLSAAAKIVIICVMFIGRLGAFTLLTIWISHPEPKIRYSEENIAIG